MDQNYFVLYLYRQLPSILLDVPLQRYIQTRTFNHFTNVYTSKISKSELSESPIENGLPDLFARVGFIKLWGAVNFGSRGRSPFFAELHPRTEVRGSHRAPRAAQYILIHVFTHV